VSDRRRYPRVQAHILYRPAGLDFLHHRYNTQDVSLAGMRVFSDETFGLGNKLELDVLLPDESVVRCWAEVVWLDELPAGAEAKFDVGLKFTDMAPADIERLATVLGDPH
jgi:c-di-GMP-binding flagellar brake protein YcgR